MVGPSNTSAITFPVQLIGRAAAARLALRGAAGEMACPEVMLFRRSEPPALDPEVMAAKVLNLILDRRAPRGIEITC